MAMTARTRPLPFPGEAVWPRGSRRGVWGSERPGSASAWASGLGTLPSLSNHKGPGEGPSVTEDERETLVALNAGSRCTNRPSSPF